MSEKATAPATRLRLGIRLRLIALLRSPRPGPRRAARGRRARSTLGWFVAFAVLLHVAALVALDAPWPNMRDPEYGLRVTRLRARTAEYPARPLVLVLGSSRTCMGVKPDAWEAVRPGTSTDPLLFNLGTVGAGPVQQLIALRRVYADGFRPPVVLLEYWPSALRQDGPHAEQYRVGRRLRLDDRSVVRDYFPDPERAERVMLAARVNPIYGNRDRWLVRAFPKWIPANRHADATWREMDVWGWLPGLDVKPDDAATRQWFLNYFERDFRERFNGYTIHPDSDRALREAVAVARANGSRVGFLYMPESSEVRGWHPPEVERAARDHFASLVRELGVPVIDARHWMDDCMLADGFHLSRVGAGAFTQRLGPAVSAAFPAIGGRP